MSNLVNGRIKRISLEQQMAEQGLVLEKGETPMFYRDFLRMANAVSAIGAKTLPSSESRIHFARCRRALKDDVDAYNDEKKRIQDEHTKEMDKAEEGDTVEFRDPIGMAAKFDKLDRMVIAVRLPKKITSAMLPERDKKSPDNEAGLAVWTADLGPLYEIDMQSANKDDEDGEEE